MNKELFNSIRELSISKESSLNIRVDVNLAFHIVGVWFCWVIDIGKGAQSIGFWRFTEWPHSQCVPKIPYHWLKKIYHTTANGTYYAYNEHLKKLFFNYYLTERNAFNKTKSILKFQLNLSMACWGKVRKIDGRRVWRKQNDETQAWYVEH